MLGDNLWAKLGCISNIHQSCSICSSFTKYHVFLFYFFIFIRLNINMDIFIYHYFSSMYTRWSLGLSISNLNYYWFFKSSVLIPCNVIVWHVYERYGVTGPVERGTFLHSVFYSKLGLYCSKISYVCVVRIQANLKLAQSMLACVR